MKKKGRKKISNYEHLKKNQRKHSTVILQPLEGFAAKYNTLSATY